MGYGCTASYKYRSGGYLLDDQDRAKPDDMWDARSNGKESGGCWRERDDPRDVECICLSNLCNTDDYFRQYINALPQPGTNQQPSRGNSGGLAQLLPPSGPSNGQSINKD
ncbi:hypothetical protein WR25_17992 [Diploscapter pachys]|uniref:Uncharacterized protein n=1 Tax=Diploscapter pachys TaxID=2018661 RepID=A0A2A2JFS2_9BILA|nr:hypothetical protein WR25_17992 [Diploscapter pachys]